MNRQQPYLGQDVVYILPTNKEECAAKVVRIVDKTKNTVNLTIFTDNADHNNIVRNVTFDEAGTQAPNTWHFQEQQEQARTATQGSSR
jgi:hypothetical protein